MVFLWHNAMEMLKMNTTPEQDDPSSSAPDRNIGQTAGQNQHKQAQHTYRVNNGHGTTNGNGHDHHPRPKNGLIGRFQSLFKGKNDTTLREAIEEFIEINENGEETEVSLHERTLISNVLKLRDLTVVDVMIPRADIIAIDIDTSQEDLLKLLASQQYSRIPIYRDTLDDVAGTIHIKDILAHLSQGKTIKVEGLLRDVPVISPSMQVLDLMLMMKKMKKHMAMVVDEFGGIDGLVTVGDVIEAIIGEIDDEYDTDDEPQIVEESDGSVLIDGRLDLDEFEAKFGSVLTADEREEVDTIGGLVFSMAGRVPARGEILSHEESGMVIKVVDADPRRVNRVKIKNIPLTGQSNTI